MKCEYDGTERTRRRCEACDLYNAAVDAQRAAATAIAKAYNSKAENAWLNEFGVFAHIEGKVKQVASAEQAAPFAALTGAVVKAARKVAALRSDSAMGETESKYPCFWCGSMQAHDVGYPTAGSLTTVPACKEHAATYTFRQRTETAPVRYLRPPMNPDDPLLALPTYQLRPCPRCGVEPRDVSFSLDTGICARCEPCATERCIFPAGHKGDCVESRTGSTDRNE